MGKEVKIPSESEFRRLPRWARVALAARSARRALLSYTGDHVDNIVEAVEVAEKFAYTSPTPFELRSGEAASEVDDASRLAVSAENSEPIAKDGEGGSNLMAARSAYYAAQSALEAIVATYANARRSIADAKSAYMAAIYACDADPNSAAGICSDFNLLKAEATSNSWGHSTSVPASIFPPLIELTDDSDFEHSEAELVLRIDPGSAPPELLAKFFVKLDQLYRLRGGSGLTIKAEGTGFVASDRKVKA